MSNPQSSPEHSVVGSSSSVGDTPEEGMENLSLSTLSPTQAVSGLVAVEYGGGGGGGLVVVVPPSAIPVPILLEYLLQRNKTLEDIAATAQTEYGALCLQRMLADTSEEALSYRRFFIGGILKEAYSVIVDRYGYLVFLKMVETANRIEIGNIVTRLAMNNHELILAACHFNGSKVLQEMIKQHWRCPAMQNLVRAIFPHVFLLLLHPVGKYVLLSCFAHLDKFSLGNLSKQLRIYIKVVIQDRGGHRLKNYATGENGESEGDSILKMIIEAAPFLATDAKGNFLVQRVMHLRHPVYSPAIIEQLIRSGRLLEIACSPSGNFVIREALRFTEVKRNQGKYVQLNKRLRMVLMTHCSEFLKMDPYGQSVYDLLLVMEKRSPLQLPVQRAVFG